MRVLALLLLLAPTAGAITLSTEAPVVGEPLTLTFDAAQDSVLVVYRPGSVAADTVLLRATGTTLTFSPERAGVVNVTAGDEKKALSVRFASAPISGIFVMAFAGLVLFGGAFFSLRALLAQDELPDITLRADT